MLRMLISKCWPIVVVLCQFMRMLTFNIQQSIIHWKLENVSIVMETDQQSHLMTSAVHLEKLTQHCIS